MIKLEGEFICKLPKNMYVEDQSIFRSTIEETYKDLVSSFEIEYYSFTKINAKPYGSKGYLETVRRVQVIIDIEAVVAYNNTAAVEISLFKLAEKLFPGSENEFIVKNIDSGYCYSWKQEEIVRLVNHELESYYLENVDAVDYVPNSEAYNVLMKLVGLKKIKEIVDQILATVRINHLRRKCGYAASHNTLHMVFTGNPGTAKTTVARLLAKILVDKGVIQKTDMMECGRADLVGKYLGWTAKMIKEKFKEAKGGMLFIDEAYSLSNNNDDYGNEAIATIVQEMENNREDTIVVFAGYEDKMVEFLSHNEGLRSRIAFQLNFPDYSEQELMDILELMLTLKAYSMTPEAKEKCRTILCEAKNMPYFGNGRYVRTLLERAVIRQAYRLDRAHQEDNPTIDEIVTLIAEDFEKLETIETKKDYKEHKKSSALLLGNSP